MKKKTSVPSNENEVIEKILNIQLPKTFFNGNKNIDIKDLFDKKLKDIDIKIKKNKHLYTLLFVITNIILIVGIKSFPLVLISKIPPSSSLYIIRVFVEFFPKSTVSDLLSKLTFSRFVTFASAMFSIIGNLSKNKKKKHTMNSLAEALLTDKTTPGIKIRVPDSVSKNNFKKLPENTPVVDIEHYRQLGAYTGDALDLSRLGVNIPEFHKDTVKFSIQYDDFENMYVLIIHTSTIDTTYNQGYSRYYNNPVKKQEKIFIHPLSHRTKMVREIKNESSNLLKDLLKKKKDIEDYRNLQRLIKTKNELEYFISQDKDEILLYEKNTKQYRDTDKRLSINKKALEEINRALARTKGKSANIEFLIKNYDNIVKTAKDVETNSSNIDKLDTTNINYYYPIYKKTLTSAKNFLQTYEVIDMNIKPEKNNQDISNQLKATRNEMLNDFEKDPIKKTTKLGKIQILDDLDDEPVEKPRTQVVREPAKPSDEAKMEAMLKMFDIKN